MKFIILALFGFSVSKAFSQTVNADIQYSMSFQTYCNISPNLNFGDVSINSKQVDVGSSIATATLNIQCDANIPIKIITNDNSGSLDMELSLNTGKTTYNNIVDLQFKNKAQSYKKATTAGNDWFWGTTSGAVDVIEFSVVLNSNYTGQAKTDFKNGHSFKLNNSAKSLNIVF